MTHDAPETWDRLAAERAALRADLARSIRALAERSADPFGVKGLVRRHPLLAAGGAAALGAVLGRALAPPREHVCDGRCAPPPSAAADAPDPFAPLRDALVRAATPWVESLLDDAPPAPDTDRAPREDADPPA